jgi:hypothetical protein
VLKALTPISLVGRIDFETVHKTETTASIQLDHREPSHLASTYAPEQMRVPRSAEMIAYLFVPTEISESTVGDFDGKHRATILPKFGTRYAANWYRLQVTCVVVPVIVRRLRKLLIWSCGLMCFRKILDWISHLFGP